MHRHGWVQTRRAQVEWSEIPASSRRRGDQRDTDDDPPTPFDEPLAARCRRVSKSLYYW